jgi:glycosyltransferase involved in cell wall biosynthesis
MRILLYNWVRFDDPERRGGGIRVYQTNLVQSLVSAGHQVVCLESGVEYSLTPRPPSLRPAPCSVPGVKSYTLVDSTVTAPGHACYGATGLFERDATFDVFRELLRSDGPFDVVHFDTLEGLPFSCLAAPREVNPATRVTMYLHNYYPICPQVNLWKREQVNCTDYGDGADCVTCLPLPTLQREFRRAYRISSALRQAKVRPGTPQYTMAYWGYGHARRTVWRARRYRRAIQRRVQSSARAQPLVYGLDTVGSTTAKRPADAGAVPVQLRPPLEPRSSADGYRTRREAVVDLVATHVDTVLATSQRVAELAAHYGIPAPKVHVAYIGTAMAAEQATSVKRTSLHEPGRLTIAYLGYLRKDKGSYFMLDALLSAPRALLERLHLVLAAPLADEAVVDQLDRFSAHLGGLTLYDGYRHADLPTILAPVDLGVVPVLWEDNLPQVAIEMVSQGVPILTSDLGGAQELGGNNTAFTFPAGDAAAFVARLEAVANGATSLGEFWNSAMTLKTMDSHLEDLTAVWGGVPEPH